MRQREQHKGKTARGPELARLAEELADDEVLLFAARPSGPHLARILRPLRLIGFALLAFTGVLVAVGFVITWGQTNGTQLLPCIGFVPIALAMLLTLAPGWAAKRFGDGLYAVTDRRCIVWFREGLVGGYVVRSFDAEDVRGMHRRDRSDGVGDLIFQTDTISIPMQNGMQMPTTREYGFYAIPDVVEVERLVREAFVLDGPSDGVPEV